MRPWNRVVDSAVDHLVIKGGDDDRSELQVKFYQICSAFLNFPLCSFQLQSKWVALLTLLLTLSLLTENMSCSKELICFSLQNCIYMSGTDSREKLCFHNWLTLLFYFLQMYASQYFSEISELLRRLPRVILLMLKTNDCLRAVNNSLVLYLVPIFLFNIIRIGLEEISCQDIILLFWSDQQLTCVICTVAGICS